MRVGLLSDTHGFLDNAILECFEQCDEIWHAGDFGALDLLERLRQAKPVRAVYGNIDGPELQAALPRDLEWECQGLRVYMTHIGGHPERYDSSAKRELMTRRPGVFVCGHSHVLRVARDPAFGWLYLNPGACGHQGWHTRRTLLRFTLESGTVSNMEAVDLGGRGRGSGRYGKVEESG